jgi:hypothetical protein
MTAIKTTTRRNRQPEASTKEVLARFQKAAKALQTAKSELDAIGIDWRNWGSGEATYYADQIAEMLSCDHGEAGLEAIIESLKKL